MKEEVKIVVPRDWSAITLRDYLKFRNDMETYKDNEDAIEAVLFHHLCKMPVEWIQQLDIDTYVNIRKDLVQFLNANELPLQRFITIDGVEYGFEPNLSKMSYGAYVDISKYETMEMNDKWADMMSILYRPVKQKVGKFYDITTYEGKIDGEKFLDLGMDIHWGTLFFLKSLLKDLSKDIQKSLMESMEIPHNIKLILERNGNPTHL
jgi:hypothetical protein